MLDVFVDLFDIGGVDFVLDGYYCCQVMQVGLNLSVIVVNGGIFGLCCDVVS